MSASVNKSMSGVQTRFNKRAEPTLIKDVPTQIVTRKAGGRNVAPEMETSLRKMANHVGGRMWRPRREPATESSTTEQHTTSKQDKNNTIQDHLDSCNGADALPMEDNSNREISASAMKNDSESVDSTEEGAMEDFDPYKEKSKNGKHLRTLVNRLAPTPGFVDKNSLPSDLQSRRRVRRLASLNAAAKVNVYFEPSSTLAGRSLNDIMQHSKKLHEEESSEDGEQIADEKENNLGKTSGHIASKNDNYLASTGLLFESMFGNGGNGECSQKSSLIKRECESSEEEGQTKRTKLDENGRYSTIVTNKRLFRGKEVVDVGLQVELPRGPALATTRAGYCKCRSSKVIDVPIQSYVSTYSKGTLVSIPITKTHRLTPHVPEKPPAELVQGDLACRSKRIAGLNSRAMLNAILTEERKMPGSYTGGTKYRKTAKKGYYEHGLNNTVPSMLKIPKINFAATSTSNFSTFGRGKPWASHIGKALSPKSVGLSHDGPKRTNGWFFLEPPMKKPYYYGDCVVTRKYYSGIKRNDEVIYVRDSVLLKSGPRRKDLPFVARVSGFWEENDGPHAGEMMMSVLWYYRPEQTEIGMQPDIHGENEILASRHKDDNSVACIVDKCYVLSYPEYCRYRAALKRSQDSRVPSANPVPPGHATKCGEQTPLTADPKLVFFCRQIYDYRMGRIMKNPVIYSVG